ncbi:MAG: hypothetical protein H7293_08990 [Candidatus Saccharibacteria bacterium]|nr:hypothetical protein [Rhodoferax sp.]
MYTSAHATKPAHTPASYVYTGRLLQRAQARTALSEATGHAVPVVCFDMELDTPLKTHMHVEQPFPEGAFAAAQAAAHRLTEGTRVTVEHPMDTVRIVGKSTTHIHVIRDPQPE